MQHEYTFRVRYKDTDQMGVVYYANYFIWFEIGRSEFMRSINLSYREMEENQVYMPVIEAYCQYKQPARYDEVLKIVTTINFMQEVKMSFHYDIVHFEKGNLLASGQTTHAFVNPSGRPVVLRKHNPSLWESLKAKVADKEEIN